MSDSSSLQIISEGALKRISEKQAEHVASLKLAETELDKHSTIVLSGVMEKLNTICESTLWEASSLKALAEEGFGKTFQMLEDDFDASTQRALADVQLKMTLTKQSLDRLRTSYCDVLKEYESVQQEVVEMTRDSAAAALMLSAPEAYAVLASDKRLSAEELASLLGKLLEVEQQLSQRVGEKILSELSQWQLALEQELSEVRQEILKNNAMALSVENSVRKAAVEYSKESLAAIELRVASMERSLSEGAERMRDATASLLNECTKRTAEEIDQVLALADGRRAKGEERLRHTLDENMNDLKQTVSVQEQEVRAKMEGLVSATTSETERLAALFASLKQRATSEQNEAVSDLLNQFERATAEFGGQLSVIGDRGVKQLNALMEESDLALKNLSKSVVERFYKSNHDYVLVLNASHSDIQGKLAEVKSNCLSQIEELSKSLKTNGEPS